MEKITGRVKALAKSYGADAVGIATTETLAGGPPSTDLTYVLPEARSAVTFAVPLDQDCMDPWFNKRSHADHFQNNIRTNVIASGISLEIANYLQQKGFAAVPLASNAAYRQETPNGRFDEKPPISHRYLAVRSGVGFFGLSGNVLTADHGEGAVRGGRTQPHQPRRGQVGVVCEDVARGATLLPLQEDHGIDAVQWAGAVRAARGQDREDAESDTKKGVSHYWAPIHQRW